MQRVLVYYVQVGIKFYSVSRVAKAIQYFNSVQCLCFSIPFNTYFSIPFYIFFLDSIQHLFSIPFNAISFNICISISFNMCFSISFNIFFLLLLFRQLEGQRKPPEQAGQQPSASLILRAVPTVSSILKVRGFI